MADIKKFAEVAKVAINTGKVLIKDEDFVNFVCGKYSDGTNRNLGDAIRGEFLSPEQKKKATSKKKKKKKKSTKFKL